MDITWLLVVLVLLILFSSISITGALRRIAAATEKTSANIQALLAAFEKLNSRS